MSVTAGAPDPTFGDVQGSKSQWQLSKEQLNARLTVDLTAITAAPSWRWCGLVKCVQYILILYV